MLKAILFDLDDTLIVEENAVVESFFETSLLVEHKYGIDANEFAKTARIKIREIWYQLPTIEYARKISISSWEALWAEFDSPQEEIQQLRSLAGKYRFDAWTNALKAFSIKDEALAKKLAKTYPEIRRSKYILFPEAIEVLQVLHPLYRMAIVTNGIPDIQRGKIIKSGIESFFESVVVSVEVGAAKPDSRIFQVALEDFGISNNQAIMVGNNPERDVEGAGNAGIKSVWINRDGAAFENNHQPDFILNDLKGLPEILDNL